LVEDRVDGDRGLACLAVADDELALTAADRSHGVDRLDSGLKRFVNRFATGQAGGLNLHASGHDVLDGALTVDGFAEGVDDTSEETVTRGDREDVAGGAHRLTLGYVAYVAEDDGADGVLVEVEGQADGASLELEHLVDRRIGKTRHPGDTVADLGHPSHLGPGHLGLEALEVLAQCGCYFRGVDGEFGHVPVLLP